MYYSIAYNVPSSKLTQVMTTSYKITLYGRRHIAILATTSPKTAAKMLQPSHPANLRWILASSIRNWSLEHMKISIHAYLAATPSYNSLRYNLYCLQGWRDSIRWMFMSSKSRGIDFRKYSARARPSTLCRPTTRFSAGEPDVSQNFEGANGSFVRDDFMRME